MRTSFHVKHSLLQAIAANSGLRHVSQLVAGLHAGKGASHSKLSAKAKRKLRTRHRGARNFEVAESFHDCDAGRAEGRHCKSVAVQLDGSGLSGIDLCLYAAWLPLAKKGVLVASAGAPGQTHKNNETRA